MDTVVANFAFSLPAKHKVRGLQKKRLLRKAVEPLLPHEVVHGRKRGFSIPAAAWLRGELEPFARETLAPGVLRRQGYFDPAAVARVLDEHVAGRRDNSRQLWGLLAFTLWHERHVEGVRRDVPLESIGARREGLGRLHGERASARLPAARRSCLRAAGPRGRDHRARLRADAAADRVARHDRDRDRPPRRPLGARQGAADARAAEGAAPLGEAARLRSRARPRLARADDDRAPARHPERDDVRLRVGVAAAPARLPRRDARRRPRLDPAGAPRAVQRRFRRSCASTRA